MDCHWTLEDLSRASPSRCRGTVHRFLALFAGNKQPARGLREVDSWFEGSFERPPQTGNGSIPLLWWYTPTASCRNLLQTAFIRVLSGFTSDSWFEGNDTWFE